MYSAKNNYEIGVFFDKDDTDHLDTIKNYIQFLRTEGDLVLSEEKISNILKGIYALVRSFHKFRSRILGVKEIIHM